MKNNEKKLKMIVYSDVLYGECIKLGCKPSEDICEIVVDKDEFITEPRHIYKFKSFQKKPIDLTSYNSIYIEDMEQYDIIVFDMNYKIGINYIHIYDLINYPMESIFEMQTTKVFIVLNYKMTDLSIDATYDSAESQTEYIVKALKNNYSLLKFIKIPLEDIATTRLSEKCLFGKDFEQKILTEYFKSAKTHKILRNVIVKEGQDGIIDNKYPIKIIAKDMIGNIVSGAVRYGDNWVIYLPQSGLPIKEKINTLYCIGKDYYKNMDKIDNIIRNLMKVKQIQDEREVSLKEELSNFYIVINNYRNKLFAYLNGQRKEMQCNSITSNKKKNYNKKHIKFLEIMRNSIYKNQSKENKQILVTEIYGTIIDEEDYKRKREYLNRLIFDIRKGFINIGVSKNTSKKIIENNFDYIVLNLSKKQIKIDKHTKPSTRESI